MHYAALMDYEWDEYIQAMKNGLHEHGQVRAGLYLRNRRRRRMSLVCRRMPHARALLVARTERTDERRSLRQL